MRLEWSGADVVVVGYTRISNVMRDTFVTPTPYPGHIDHCTHWLWDSARGDASSFRPPVVIPLFEYPSCTVSAMIVNAAAKPLKISSLFSNRFSTMYFSSAHSASSSTVLKSKLCSTTPTLLILAFTLTFRRLFFLQKNQKISGKH